MTKLIDLVASACFIAVFIGIIIAFISVIIKLAMVVPVYFFSVLAVSFTIAALLVKNDLTQEKTK